MATWRRVSADFRSGELSPQWLDKVESPQFQSGAARLLNVLPLWQGGCVTRPGLQVVKELDDGGHPVQRLVVDQYYEFTISGADITLRDIAPNPIRPSAFEEDTTALSAQVEVANGAMVYTTGAGSLRGESQVIVLEKSRSGIVIRENQIRPFGLERELFDHTFLLVDRGQQTPIEIRVRYTRQQVVRPVPGVVITAHLSAKPFTFEARQRNAVVPAYIGAAAIYQNRLVLAQTDHLWFSETGNHDNFNYVPDVDSDGNKVVSAEDPIYARTTHDIDIHSIFVGTRLLLFGEEKTLYVPDGVLEPATLELREAQAIGSKRGIPIVDVRGSAVFTSATGNDIRMLDFAELRAGYVAPSISYTGSTSSTTWSGWPTSSRTRRSTTRNACGWSTAAAASPCC